MPIQGEHSGQGAAPASADAPLRVVWKVRAIALDPGLTADQKLDQILEVTDGW